MFNEYMTVGHDRMSKGVLEEAALAFEEAIAHAKSADNKASALQMRGITERLLGELDASMETLDYAYATAEDPVLRARITRDLGMTYLDQEKHFMAGDAFITSYRVLSRNNELVEAAVSRGFLGRAMLVRGRRKEAVRLLRETDKVLRGGNRDYELNNLIWWMRASHLTRFIGLPRAICLIGQTGQLRRWKELAVIVVGGDRLYRLLRKYG